MSLWLLPISATANPFVPAFFASSFFTSQEILIFLQREAPIKTISVNKYSWLY